MSVVLRVASALALAIGLVSTSPMPASAQGGIAVGTLTCNVASGWGFVFGSSRALNCTYSTPGRYEYYVGNISRFGVDIGYTQGGVMIWTVIAPAMNLAPGAIAGAYAGGTASA